MSKQRMIRDSFWTDSYVEKLTPDEKLIFLYLLTNPLNNVAGIYEIRTKRIAFETGYDIEVVETILNRFESEKKILRYKDWIVLVNHLKNQASNPSIIIGCRRILRELPACMKSRVTGWVQAGTLNLTLLNFNTEDKSSDSINNMFNKYSEDYEETIDIDSGEKVPSEAEQKQLKRKGLSEKKKKLVDWLIEHQDRDKLRFNRTKQLAALNQLIEMNVSPKEITNTLKEIEQEPYWKSKKEKPDFKTVVSRIQSQS